MVWNQDTHQVCGIKWYGTRTLTNLGTQFCLLIDLHVNGEVPLLGHQLGQINWKAIGVIQPPGYITCRGERGEREGGQDEKYKEELRVRGNSRSYHKEKLVEASRPIRMQVFQQTVAIPWYNVIHKVLQVHLSSIDREKTLKVI